MLRALLHLIRPAPIARSDELAGLLQEQAAALTHKATVAYCRVKAGVHVRELFKEAGFRVQMESCRAQAHVAVLADLVMVADGFLRDCGSDRAEALAMVFADCLAADPNSAIGGEGAAPVEELRRRLARARLAPPPPSYEVGRAAGAAIFALLPIHPSLRRNDREAVVNLVRFGMVSFRQELERRVDTAALAEALGVGPPVRGCEGNEKSCADDRQH